MSSRLFIHFRSVRPGAGASRGPRTDGPRRCSSPAQMLEAQTRAHARHAHRPRRSDGGGSSAGSRRCRRRSSSSNGAQPRRGHPGGCRPRTDEAIVARNAADIAQGELQAALVGYRAARRLAPEDAEAVLGEAALRWRAGSVDGRPRPVRRAHSRPGRAADGAALVGTLSGSRAGDAAAAAARGGSAGACPSGAAREALGRASTHCRAGSAAAARTATEDWVSAGGSAAKPSMDPIAGAAAAPATVPAAHERRSAPPRSRSWPSASSRNRARRIFRN